MTRGQAAFVTFWALALAFCLGAWYLAGWLTLRAYKLGEL